MSDHCPIPRCVLTVGGPMRICKPHYRLVPRPQQDALNHYAKTHKYGPSHKAAFERAVESVSKLVAGRDPRRQATAPYRDG